MFLRPLRNLGEVRTLGNGLVGCFFKTIALAVAWGVDRRGREAVRGCCSCPGESIQVD